MIAKLKKIVEEKQCAKIKGVMIDMTTANFVCDIHSRMKNKKGLEDSLNKNLSGTIKWLYSMMK